MIKLIRFSLTFVLFFVLTDCKKKEIPGPQGAPGVNGTGGNASTSSSDLFVINSADWKLNGSVLEYIYSSPLITAKVVNEGGLKVFMQLSNVWWELPNSTGDLLMQCGFSEGKVRLTFTDIHGGVPEAPETANYRLVTLSSSAKGQSNLSSNIFIKTSEIAAQ
jgi:hypothetical protein